MSPLPVVSGALLQCSMGTVPTPLTVLPTARVIVESRPVARVTDNVPGLNITPFGLCRSPANPAVAIATAAALGVLTPMPCWPVPAGPWISPATRSVAGGIPFLASGGTCLCAYGGVISIQMPGSLRSQVS
ncbi:DUF4280 domain-containing protein [Kineosporia sp. NBRC 101731]|uniref:DUF4280 domain-containing protein n=1 Tax=Kineosporia sp. NBRC 101731 TaxID=3032199 RepID=UPI0024A354AF|nr:DUF4280 domain-containing protein [Kineosporia sp. NBRC 101731]GLY29472.1 hypothetical protein Kisp02_28370 [Kineosporia sp. NBRC 101731]